MPFHHLSRWRAPGQINPPGTRLLQQYTHTSPMMGCRFDPSGRFVFGGAQDNTISRWDLTNGQKTTQRNRKLSADENAMACTVISD